MAVAARLAASLADDFPDYSKVEVPRSDAIMSRCISMQIKLSWTPAQLADRIQKIRTVFSK